MVSLLECRYALLQNQHIQVLISRRLLKLPTSTSTLEAVWKQIQLKLILPHSPADVLSASIAHHLVQTSEQFC